MKARAADCGDRPAGRREVAGNRAVTHRKTTTPGADKSAWSRVFSAGADDPRVLITQRSKVQILPPQPIFERIRGDVKELERIGLLEAPKTNLS